MWKPAPVALSPEVVMRSWRVMEVTSPYWEGASRHFVGYNVSDLEGRVSSEIVQFDHDTMTGITRSGRVYRLDGDAGHDGDADYVWARWKDLNHVESEKDVSEEI
jgi:hypothetical protein